MPTILRVGPYRIGFWSRENDEPPHVHVRRERLTAKFWLDPRVRLAQYRGFAKHELNDIREIIEFNRGLLLRAWHEHFRQGK
ncbi:MAG: DUF4160 domain-containing protein [Tepidisphaeraceae bacterium]